MMLHHMKKQLLKENMKICTNTFLKIVAGILISVTGHVTLVGFYNYLTIIPILYFLQYWQAPQKVLSVFLKE